VGKKKEEKELTTTMENTFSKMVYAIMGSVSKVAAFQSHFLLFG
jgi:hypothetical protein